MSKPGHLPKGPAFERVYREGSAVAGPFFVFRYVANDGEGHRWAFAVGKKLEKRAVRRNRARRRMRTALEAVGMANSVDLVVTARGPAMTATFPALCGAMAQMVKRTKLPVSGPKQ
jgi:ribonuclease P protein component